MSKMSLEERALRHAVKFFDGPKMWWNGSNANQPGQADGATCVGLLLNKYRRSNQEPS